MSKILFGQLAMNVVLSVEEHIIMMHSELNVYVSCLELV